MAISWLSSGATQSPEYLQAALPREAVRNRAEQLQTKRFKKKLWGQLGGSGISPFQDKHSKCTQARGAYGIDEIYAPTLIQSTPIHHLYISGQKQVTGHLAKSVRHPITSRRKPLLSSLKPVCHLGIRCFFGESQTSCNLPSPSNNSSFCQDSDH